MFSVNEIGHMQPHFSLHVPLVLGLPFLGLASLGEAEINCQKCFLKFSCMPPSAQWVIAWSIKKLMLASLQDADGVLSFTFTFTFFVCEECEVQWGNILSLLLKSFYSL